MWFRSIRSIKRRFRFLVQRLVRGFSDDETWSLDQSLAKLIYPRLVRFKELDIGHPHDLNSQKWSDSLDEMIATFKFLASEERWDCYDQKKWDEVQGGLNLFAKYYLNLWW